MDPGQAKHDRNRGVALWNNLVISVTSIDGARDRDRQGDRQDRLGQEPARPAGHVHHRGAARAQGRDHRRRLRRRPRPAQLGRGARSQDRQIRWKTYSIPAPGEPGSETWKDKHNAWQTGGGAFYVTGSYDPATNLTYWGSGNPVPGYDAAYRPGDNLYTSSAIAFDAASGKITWWHQYTPNDNRDYDETGTHILIDTKVNGEDRKIVSHAGRNGFNYIVRSRQRPVPQGRRSTSRRSTWTKGIDPKTGKPVDYDPAQGRPGLCRGRRRQRRQARRAAVVPGHRRRQQLLAGVLQPQDRAPLHPGNEGCANVTPDYTAHVRAISPAAHDRCRAHHQQRGRGRSGHRRGEEAQRVALSELRRRALDRRRHRGDGAARRHDRGARRPDAGGAVARSTSAPASTRRP